jgi:hypothetical protein
MRRMLLGCIVLTLCAMSSHVAWADLVVNGGFETGDFTGWTQSGNTDFTFVDGLPHSGSFAAWFGPTGSLGFLSQTLTTIPGETDELHYWLQHEPFGTGTPNAVQVFWGDLSSRRRWMWAPFPIRSSWSAIWLRWALRRN